jgi:ribonucleoside-diphosphate reductase alpha chain
MEERMDVLVTFLNELIDYQDYMVPQSYKATKDYRPLGIGVVNYAYFLAKRGMKYGDQASLNATHELAEQMYYFALKASNKYAQYKGAKVPVFDKLIYSDGKTLLDTYCKRVDELTQEPLHMDWDTLKESIAEHGIYNSTLLAFMPSESSSTVLNATSGIDPIRKIITAKANKRISFKQVAPEPVRLKNQYSYLWDMTPEKMEGYLKCLAVIQKFTCQSISTNLSYNPDHFPGGKVDITVLMNHTAILTKYGLKTRYYVNTKGENEDKVEELLAQAEQNQEEPESDTGDSGGCESGACAI